jgi:hypothetical protein
MVSAITFFVLGVLCLYTAKSTFIQIIGGITAVVSYFCMHGAWNNRNKNNTEG